MLDADCEDTNLRNGTLAVYEAAIRAKRMQKLAKSQLFTPPDSAFFGSGFK